MSEKSQEVSEKRSMIRGTLLITVFGGVHITKPG